MSLQPREAHLPLLSNTPGGLQMYDVISMLF